VAGGTRGGTQGHRFRGGGEKIGKLSKRNDDNGGTGGRTQTIGYRRKAKQQNGDKKKKKCRIGDKKDRVRLGGMGPKKTRGKGNGTMRRFQRGEKIAKFTRERGRAPWHSVRSRLGFIKRGTGLQISGKTTVQKNTEEGGTSW